MSRLILIPTPIGNLQDITLRAIEVLNSVDFILCEDTRHSGKLLQHLSIEKNLLPFHAHNEHEQTPKIIAQLLGGKTAGLITDAGTPGISDPGFLLVRECLKNEIDIECLPGPTAFVPALIMSGFPSERFCFEGFLPHKKGRQTRLKSLTAETRTMIFYESPNRLLKLLAELKNIFGESRRASVSRELTKMFEETKRGTFGELENYFSGKEVKGEIVVVVEGCHD